MSDREKLSAWMVRHGFATGHGDDIDALLKELSWQVGELRQQKAEAERIARRWRDVVAVEIAKQEKRRTRDGI